MDPLHVGEPNFGDPGAFLRRFDHILSSRRFTNDGPLAQDLESRIAELTSARHAVATCSATVALQLLARALDLRGEVVMPSFTFVGTAHAFAWLGLRPVFCDVEPRTHGVEPGSMDAAIGPECSAVVAVHTWGIPSDISALEHLAGRRGLPLIFDAAHALGCENDGLKIGQFGTAEVFSLHATKIVSSFEGGMVTTNDGELATRLRLLRNFGFTGYDRVEAIGTNAKLSELHAAAGLTTLEMLPALMERNRSRFEQYRALSKSIPGLRMLDVNLRGASNHQYIVCELGAEAARVSRDALVQALHAEGIYARRYFHPGCHRMPPYAGASSPVPLLVTEAISERVIVLPNGPSVSEEAIRAVMEIIALVVENGPEFSARHSASS